MSKKSIGENIALISLLVGICGCIGTYLALPQIQRLIEGFNTEPQHVPTEVISNDPKETSPPILATESSNSSPVSDFQLAEENDYEGNAIFLALEDETISGIVETVEGMFVSTSGFRHGIFHSSDGGLTWEGVNNGLSNLDVQHLAADVSGHLYAGSSNGLWKSKDSGSTWQSCSKERRAPGKFFLMVTSVTTHPETTLVWLSTTTTGTGSGHLYYSMTNCLSWNIPEYPQYGPPAAQILLSRNDYDRIYLLYTSGRIMSSNDSGSSWSVLASVGENYAVKELAEGWEDPFPLYAGTNMGVYKSEDGGYSWKPINLGLPNQGFEYPVSHIRTNPGSDKIVYLSSGNEIYYSLDEGGEWSKLGEIPIEWLITEMLVIQTPPNRLLIGTNGGGLWKLDLP